MEPLFSPDAEQTLLPPDLHTPTHAPVHQVNAQTTKMPNGSGNSQPKPYSRHVIHVVTQYYVAEDVGRAHEV